MKTIAVAIEGILAREPIGENYAASAVNQEGVWLTNLLQQSSWVVLVTGSHDVQGVTHFVRSHFTNPPGIEFPFGQGGSALWIYRLRVLENLNRQYRGNLVIVETMPAIRKALHDAGAMVIEPWFTRSREAIGEDEHVPLRTINRFWGE